MIQIFQSKIPAEQRIHSFEWRYFIHVFYRNQTKKTLHLKQIKPEIRSTGRVFSMDIADAYCQSINASFIDKLFRLKKTEKFGKAASFIVQT